MNLNDRYYSSSFSCVFSLYWVLKQIWKAMWAVLAQNLRFPKMEMMSSLSMSPKSIYFQQFSSLLYSPKAMWKSMIKRKSERRKSIEHRGRYVPDCQPTDQVYLQTKRREIQHGHDRDTLVLIFASAFVNSICVDEEPLACIIDWLQIAIVVGGYHCCHAAFLLIVGFIAHPKCISIMILPLDAFAPITIREWRK